MLFVCKECVTGKTDLPCVLVIPDDVEIPEFCPYDPGYECSWERLV